MYNPDGVAPSPTIDHRTTTRGWRAATWGVTILSRGITPSIARPHARKGAEEVTPKGLYGRQGRVDERSEIYPV